MEFANTGLHCAYSGCNQKDFLPFKCDVCSLELCLLHRDYKSHECVGRDAKDWTSMDCPICQKSVKYTKSTNVDEVWEQHYLNECTKEASRPKGPLPECPSCKTKMALSNRYNCGKCGLRICLKCRTPEAHNCVVLAREVRLSTLPHHVKSGRGEGSGSNQMKSKIKATSSIFDSKMSSKTTNTSSSHKKSNAQVQIHVCPLCSKKFKDQNTLVAHASTCNGDSNSSSRSRSSSSTVDLTSTPISSLVPTSTQQHVCPLCGLHFANEHTLVTHASTCDGTCREEHGRGQGSVRRGSNNSRDSCTTS
jgi:hypothetical protein